jgi:hypothetical protein
MVWKWFYEWFGNRLMKHGLEMVWKWFGHGVMNGLEMV